MFHLQCLFQLFEWHACKLAGLTRKAVPPMKANGTDHYSHQFTVFFFTFRTVDNSLSRPLNFQTRLGEVLEEKSHQLI